MNKRNLYTFNCLNFVGCCLKNQNDSEKKDSIGTSPRLSVKCVGGDISQSPVQVHARILPCQ